MASSFQIEEIGMRKHAISHCRRGALLSPRFRIVSPRSQVNLKASRDVGKAEGSTRRIVLTGLSLLPLFSLVEQVLPQASAADGDAADGDISAGSLTHVFFDVTLEGEDIGRIEIETFDDIAKTGSARFKDLAEGKDGVGYRRSRFDGIFPTHLKVEGATSLSYAAGGDSAITGGDSIADLRLEMASSKRLLHDRANLVSLMVEEDKERPITEKLVARDGKLITVALQAGEAPNGTSFTITRTPAPQLDATSLVIGRVVKGMDVIDRIASLPFSKPRDDWYDGPFFAAGKAIGDKRATVAEKGFNRPFKRVVVKKCGIV